MAQNPSKGMRIALFEGLPPGDIDRLLNLAERRTFGAGEVVISEGDAGDALFIVASGQVRVEKATIGRTQETLTLLGPGECFGELSLVDRQPRSATIRAAGDTDVYMVAHDDLYAFLSAHPEVHRRVLENLVRIVAQRLRNVDDTLVQSVYDSIVLIDRSLRVLRWSRQAEGEDLLQAPVTPESAVGRDLFDALPHLGEGVRQKLAQAIDSGRVATLHLDYEGAGGDRLYFEVTAAPCIPGADRAGAVLGIRDVTETRSLEARLIQVEKLALAGQMSAEIGHELNNYLTILSGHTELLRLNPDLRENEAASKSLRAIWDQLGKIQEFSAGLMDLGILRSKTEHSDLNRLIDKLVQFIQGRSRFRRVEFELRLDPELPLIEIDPGQIQQVFLNLYANAADAMGSGRVVTITRFCKAEKQVVVQVQDSGPGIPEEALGQIFHSGFTTKSTGHGVGLAVCHRIVENHNGDISVDSEPGQGATFTLTFQV